MAPYTFSGAAMFSVSTMGPSSGWSKTCHKSGSYGRKGSRDVEWTDEHSEDRITDKDLIARGSDLLNDDERLNAKARGLIGRYMQKDDWWLQ